jgi:hypothetical protein
MMKVPNHFYVLIFVPLLLPQSAPTQVITQRVWWLTFREYSKYVTLYTIYISVAVNGPGMTTRYGVAREKRWARSQGHTEISSAKTYKCKIYILLSQVYCVWQVVKTSTIISNNPVQFKPFLLSFNAHFPFGWNVANGHNFKTRHDMIVNCRKACQLPDPYNHMLFWTADEMRRKDTSWSWCQRTTWCPKGD